MRSRALTPPATWRPAAVLGRRLTIPAIAVKLLAVVLARQLLVQPIVGLADNGDFDRIMLPVGVEHTVNGYDERFGNWVNTRYAFRPPAIPEGFLFTSEIIPAALAVWLARLAGQPAFDLRALGLLHAALCLVAAAVALAAVERLPRPARLAVAAAWLLIGADVGYVCYFNSFYPEPAALLGLYCLVGSALWLLLVDGASRAAWAGFWLAAAALVLSKPQYAVLAPIVGAFGVALAALAVGRRGGRRAAGGALALCALAAVYFSLTPAYLRHQYRYNVVFYEILRHSPSPERDLAQLGLGEEYLPYAGTLQWSPNSLWGDPERLERFKRTVNQGAILAFYLRNPDRFLDLYRRASARAMDTRIAYAGNFERSSGRAPREKSYGWALWSTLRNNPLTATPLFLPLFGVVSAAVALDAWRASARGKRLALLLGFALASAATLFLVAIVGEGEADLNRHLFLCHSCLDLGFVLAALWLGGRLLGRLHRPRPLTGSAPAAGPAR